jgi:Phage integrase family
VTRRFRDINLHWHDLRHEYASRLVERGVPLTQVRDLLGHVSILTTERYDNQRLEALQPAVERLEGGKTFDPEIEATDSLSAVAVSTRSAKAEVSRIFQDPSEQSFVDSEDPTKESATSH